MNIAAFDAGNVAAVIDFFRALPEEDLTFIKEDVTDPDAVLGWLDRPGQRWLALDGETVVGFVAVLPLPGWSDHVGELRLVVHPARRRVGVGRALARHALTDAVRAGRRKVVVELATDQDRALAMFGSLGFTGEALLRDHIRDRRGDLRDLVMLAHFVDGTWADMESVGLADELSIEGTA
ncbi:MAG: GNAT family N-acetyltransferase [Solirubrobacterales bacterium]|nr:GNAT family N-acetyltransferase [Solirubrobacterales bacterium]